MTHELELWLKEQHFADLDSEEAFNIHLSPIARQAMKTYIKGHYKDTCKAHVQLIQHVMECSDPKMQCINHIFSYVFVAVTAEDVDGVVDLFMISMAPNIIRMEEDAHAVMEIVNDFAKLKNDYYDRFETGGDMA